MKLSAPETILVEYIRTALPLGDGTATRLPSIANRDWLPICECAHRHGLEPLLYRALNAPDLLSELPPTVIEDLHKAYLHTLANNLVLHNELSRLLGCFRREEIPVVLLKGCALAELLYSDMGLRPMTDLDVLIPKEAAARVSNLLVEQGYVPYFELSDGFQRSFENEQAFVRDSHPPIALDVHWHLLSESYYFERVPMDWFWQRTTQIRVNGQTARAFSAEAQLIYLMAHWVIHHKGEGLRWSYDLALLLSRYRHQIDWDEVIGATHRFGLSQALQRTLEDISVVWGVFIPPDARRILEQAQPNLGERLSFAVFTARHVDARTLWDALSMPSYQERLGYLRHTLLPSKAYMQTRYGISDARLVSLYYCWRLAKGFRMFVRSVLSIAVNSVCVLLHAKEPQSRDAQ